MRALISGHISAQCRSQEVQDGLAEVGQQVTGAVAAYAVAQTDGRTQLLALAERIDALQVL